VEEDRGAIERHDVAQRAGDRVEESFPRQARDHGVVDLEQRPRTLCVGVWADD